MQADLPICRTCGVQYPAPREECPICEDQRQYVGWDGQQWTSLAELSNAGHKGQVKPEGPGVVGVGGASGNVLWDMITYIDDDLVAAIGELGGVSAIAISHPHFYGSIYQARG